MGKGKRIKSTVRGSLAPSRTGLQGDLIILIALLCCSEIIKSHTEGADALCLLQVQVGVGWFIFKCFSQIQFKTSHTEVSLR